MSPAKYLRDLCTLPRDAAKAWRRDGLGGVVQEFCVRTVYRVVHFWRGTVIEIDLDDISHVLPPPGVEIRPLAPADWPALSTLLNHRMLEHFRQAADRGRTCLVAWRGVQPIAYFWRSEGRDPELDRFGVTVPDDVVYVWYLYVVRTERRRRIGLALLNADLPEGRVRGLRRAWMVIRTSNRRALGVARRFAAGAGIRSVGRVGYLKLLWWVYAPRTQSAPARPPRWSKYVDDLRTFPEAASLAWRRDGASGVWGELSLRTVQRIYSSWRADMFASDLGAIAPLPPPVGVEVKLLSGPVGPALAHLTGAWLLRSFERAAAEGRTCFVARRAGRVIGYIWYSTASDPGIQAYRLPLPVDAIYLWHFYVARSERGKGVGAALESSACVHARTRGYTSAWGLIDARNRAARRVARRASGDGTRMVGALTYRKLFARVNARFDAA